MKKSYFLVPLALLIVGGAYGMTGLLFPDTPGFPRIPMGEGTVGSMIARVLGVSDLLNYTDDGTVKNAAMLSGVTANGYLKRSDICPSGQYWTGIDTDGKSTCGSTTILLADMGTITDVGNGMTIYRADGTTINPVNIPTVVKSGDIIKTDGTGTGTITFSDLSVLRIDTDTTVSMDQTTSGTGVTIASALLANGSIWGRILTSTGVYNIGSSDIVAAVRGTSIVVTQTGATTSVAKDASGKYTITKTGSQGKTQLAILDSALGTGSITTVNCTRTIRKDVIEEGGAGSSPVQGSPTRVVTENITTSIATGSITPENIYTVNPGDCTNGSALTGSVPADLYTMSPWIKENTKKDIIYMVNLALSGSITDATKTTKIIKELNQTTPKDSAECNNLLGGGSDCTDIVTQKTTDADTINNPEAPVMASCKIRNQKYWSLYKEEKDLDKKCQDSRIIAIADYTTGKYNLYFSGGIKSLIPMDQTSSVNVTIDDDGNMWRHTESGRYIFDGGIQSRPDEYKLFDASRWLFTTNALPNISPFYDKANMESLIRTNSPYTDATSYAYIDGTIPSKPYKYDSKSGWDTWKYPSLTWLKPQNSGLPYISSTAGAYITGNGYISYPSVLIPGGLAGKTIEIELLNALNVGQASSQFLLTLGSGVGVRHLYNANNGNSYWVCTWGSSANGYACPSTDLIENGNTITIKLPNYLQINSLIIGNNSTLNAPLLGAIRKVSIKI